jgi:MFS family permease
MAEVTMAAGDRAQALTARAKRAIAGAFFGLAVDFYDVYLPLVALTPALAYFEPASLPAQVRVTLGLVVFVVTLIGRPIGALVFGPLGDAIGRKRTTMIAVAGFSVTTVLIGLLPSYASWGYLAIALLVALRLVDGVFMGGEYAGANPLAMEATPKELRGLVGAFIQSAYPIAYVGLSLIVTVLLTALPPAGPASAYAQWGWRIPFFLGGVLGGIFLLFYRRVEESPLWAASQRERGHSVVAPLRDLFRGANLARLGQVFVLMSGFWLASLGASATIPGLLIQYLRQPARSVTAAILVAYACVAVLYFVVSHLGQRHGRRLLLLICGAGVGLGTTLTFGLMVASALGRGPPLVTLLFAGLTVAAISVPWGIVTTYLNERFPTEVRASGYGIGYTLAVVLPSLSSFFLLGLGRLMPYVYTPLVLTALAGLLILAGAWLGPETRHVDLDREPERGGMRTR